MQNVLIAVRAISASLADWRLPTRRHAADNSPVHFERIDGTVCLDMCNRPILPIYPSERPRNEGAISGLVRS